MRPRKNVDLLLRDYLEKVSGTDRYKQDEIYPALMGLYGEVGSLMTAAKKHSREGDAFLGYKHAVVEEFGDAFWYFSAICKRIGVDIEGVISDAIRPLNGGEVLAAGDSPGSPIVGLKMMGQGKGIDEVLIDLGMKVNPILSIKMDGKDYSDRLKDFILCYIDAMSVSGVSFRDVIEVNINKTTGRFVAADMSDLPLFDEGYSHDERIPDEFEIKISPRSCGKTCMTWKGVFVGDPLTDNIKHSDGYRYHDVFHFAHASILHWSPTFRSLIRHKRKSNPKVDEQQDGGRAIVVEEGLTAWIFSCAKKMNYFEGAKGLSFDMLKTIQQFVEGYEVEECPLNLWERAILDGYEVFRKVRDNDGGIVVCSKKDRKILYKNIDG